MGQKAQVNSICEHIFRCHIKNMYLVLKKKEVQAAHSSLWIIGIETTLKDYLPRTSRSSFGVKAAWTGPRLPTKYTFLKHYMFHRFKRNIQVERKSIKHK